MSVEAKIPAKVISFIVDYVFIINKCLGLVYSWDPMIILKSTNNNLTFYLISKRALHKLPFFLGNS